MNLLLYSLEVMKGYGAGYIFIVEWTIPDDTDWQWQALNLN